MNLTTRPPRLRTALLAAALVAAHAVAEPVPDPTRPMGLADTDLRPAKAARAAAATAATAAAPAALPRLQSVQVAGAAGAGGTSSALVDGRLVRVGDRLGEHSVSAIDRNGLTLRGPRGEQRLPLLTGITQTASRATPPTTDTLATGSPQDNRP